MLETSFMLKSWGFVVGWVAHKILVTSLEAKFLFPFLGPGLWTGTWPGLVNNGYVMATSDGV